MTLYEAVWPSPSNGLERPRPARLSAGWRSPLLALTTLVHIAMSVPGAWAQPRGNDVAELDLEALLTVRVQAAASIPQPVGQAPAAITVVGADEIRAYGYRTLGQLLAAQRGFNLFSDRMYDYVGVRGFSRLGDYNSRLLLMLDGQRLNDNIYDQALLGTESLVDLELAERVEIMRGPSSSLYGGNALFGVINVVTRRPGSAGGEAALSAGSHDSGRLRARVDRRWDNGAALMLAASGWRRRGPALDLPELAGPGQSGHTLGTDFDRGGRMFARFEFEGLSLTAAASRRDKGNPATLYGALFNSPENHWLDEQGLLDLRYAAALGPRSEWTVRLFNGYYDYTGDSVYVVPYPARNRDLASGRWAGAELKLIGREWAGHTLVAGLAVARDRRQLQSNEDVDPPQLWLMDRRSGSRRGLFVQDEWILAEGVNLTLGARHDRIEGYGGELSPRVALVAQTDPDNIWKVIYAGAFRPPNAYERYYAFPGQQAANPNLAPERIRTLEALWERRLRRDWKLTTAAYLYRARNLITLGVDDAGLARFENAGAALGRGVELELERQFRAGAHLRASLGWQRARDADGGEMVNAPRAQFKLNVAMPLAGWGFGIEALASTGRPTTTGRIGGDLLTNLHVRAPQRPGGVAMSATVRNLFDRKHADPVAFDATVPTRDRIVHPGRELIVEWTWAL